MEYGLTTCAARAAYMSIRQGRLWPKCRGKFSIAEFLLFKNAIQEETKYRFRKISASRQVIDGIRSNYMCSQSGVYVYQVFLSRQYLFGIHYIFLQLILNLRQAAIIGCHRFVLQQMQTHALPSFSPFFFLHFLPYKIISKAPLPLLIQLFIYVYKV